VKLKAIKPKNGYLEIETAQRLSSNERRPHLIIRAKQATVNKVMGLA